MKTFKYKLILTTDRLMDYSVFKSKRAVKVSLFLMILLLLSFSVFAQTLINYDFETQAELDRFTINDSMTSLSLDGDWATEGLYSMQINTTSQIIGDKDYLIDYQTNTSNENEPINFSFDCITKTTSHVCHAFFNYDFETDSGYRVGITVNDANYRPKIMRFDNGVDTNIANILLGANLKGKNLTVEFFVNESGDMVARYYSDGNHLRTNTVTDTTYTSGYFGLSAYRGVDDILSVDNVVFTSGGYFVPLIEVTIDSPNDNYISNTKPTMYFTAIDEDDLTVDCDLYLNDILDSTNVSVNVNESSPFYLDLNEGMNTFYVNCTDGSIVGISGTQNIWYDPNDPFITSTSPLPFNTTTFTSYSMNIFGNITNEELDYILVEIYDEEDNLYYQNETLSFGDPTTFVYDWTFSTSSNGSDNGVWDMYFYGNDTATNENELYLSFTVNNCVPDWVCSGYASCNISDFALCNSATDQNVCGLNYTGDLSEFSAQSCDYCSHNLNQINETECVSRLKTVWYEDLNFVTCCNITGIVSDCNFGNESIGYEIEGCSPFQYGEQDFVPASTDLIVKFILAFAVFSTIFVLAFTMDWGYKKVIKK